MIPIDKVWAVVHPERGMFYGLGTNRQQAWETALLLAYNLNPRIQPEAYRSEQKRLQGQGWKAVKVAVTPL